MNYDKLSFLLITVLTPMRMEVVLQKSLENLANHGRLKFDYFYLS